MASEAVNAGDNIGLSQGLYLPNIALMGKLGAGKTTAAEYLIERFGYSRIGFGDMIRQELGPDATREDQQRHGVAMRRENGDDYWIGALIDYMKERGLGETGYAWIVDGVRFPNEYWALKEEGFITVRVVTERRQRADRSRAAGRLQNEAALDHITETSLDGYHADYTVFNQDTRDVMQTELVEVLYREVSKL